LKKDVLWRSIISLMLGFSTFILVQFLVTVLPYGNLRTLLSNMVSVPASLVVGVFFPNGKPAINGNDAWALIFIVCEIVFCAVIWFVILSWRNQKSHDAVI
jgi:hypothetical protein